MSKYRYKLEHYHAIESADIVIDGITVLAGENGCGKSTLSRWLYYLVNGSRRYEEYVYKSYIRRVYRMLRRLDMPNREMRLNMSEKEMPNRFYIQSLYKTGIDEKYDEEDFHKLTYYYKKVVRGFTENLEVYLNKDISENRQKRILNYLGIDDEGLTKQEVVYRIRDKYDSFLESTIEELNSELETRPISRLIKTISKDYEQEEDTPKNIQLYEDNVGLIDGNIISELYNLKKAIYIDTPLALFHEYDDNLFWKELNDMVLDYNSDLSLSEKKLLSRIKNILHGEARFVESDSLFEEEGELRYHSVDHNVDININKTATGFKTFIYLQRLLENGYLNQESLLLIDEPEVHLHPQWIVEYARLLVLLNKELGLKIMLATHNPDMVAALRSIAEYENVLSNTHFYISERDPESSKYVYKDLGSDIEAIFASFNIALSRIQSYGVGGIQQ